jgi:hypothetical protein
MDETGCQVNVAQARILIRKWKKRAQRATNSFRESFTVCGTSRGGSLPGLPPFVLLPLTKYNTALHHGVTLPCGKEMQGLPEGTEIVCNKIGYMLKETFMEYLEFFDKNTKVTCGIRPDGTPEWRLLLVDGHKTHVGYEACKWCNERRIFLFVLPSHTTDLSQPCDRMNFQVFKKILRNRVHWWTTRHGGGQPVTL